MFLTTGRWLNGAVAFWLMALLAVAAGVLSTVLLESSARFAHWLILVPLWAFGVWYNLLSVWLPPYILFTCSLYLGSLVLIPIAKPKFMNCPPPAGSPRFARGTKPRAHAVPPARRGNLKEGVINCCFL